MTGSLLYKNQIIVKFSGEWNGDVFKGQLTSDIHPEFQGLFADYENAVNQILLVEVENLDKKIKSISWNANIESMEVIPSELQVFPRSKAISFRKGDK